MLILRLGSHERWVDARCSASVVAVRVMIPVGPHDKRALLAARVATHVAFSTCSVTLQRTSEAVPCAALLHSVHGSCSHDRWFNVR
jgi:hypothetical protein